MSWLKKEALDLAGPSAGGAPKSNPAPFPGAKPFPPAGGKPAVPPMGGAPMDKKEPLTADAIKKGLTDLIQKEKAADKNVKGLEQALKGVEDFLKESKGDDKAPAKKEKSEDASDEKKEEKVEEKEAAY
jgi:hypothetical protein